MKQYKKQFLTGVIILVLLIISCRKPTAPSQQGPVILWTKTYGGPGNDEGKSVQQISDGGYIITGWTQSFGHGSGDVYLIKTDAWGNILWSKTYGGSKGDGGSFVQQTLDGGYIVAGETNSFGSGDYDVYLIKTDENGIPSWTKTYGGSSGDVGFSVQQTSDGGYIIAGYTESFGAGGTDVYLIKTDTNGDTLWTKTYGGISNDDGKSVQQTSDGGYIIAGSSSSFDSGNSDVYLIKTDTNGDILWTQTYGGTDGDWGSSVHPTADGGYIVSGSTYSYGSGPVNVYLIKTDANGDTLWTKAYGGDNSDAGCAVQQTSDKGYIIAGYTESFGAGGVDIYLIKTDADGDTLWTKTCGGSDRDISNSIHLTSDGGYIIVGTTFSYGAGSFDVYLIKIR